MTAPETSKFEELIRRLPKNSGIDPRLVEAAKSELNVIKYRSDPQSKMTMTFAPKSPRVGRSPKLKAKWLSNTLAYQYGNNGNKKSEIIVLCNDIDQYLQDIFQSIDTKARGKISSEEFKLLTDVLYLRDLNDTGESGHDLSFSEFHARLCEHFASYGDYTGFLVNQNFRTINVDSNGTSRNGSVATTESSASMCRRKEFQRRMANSKTHNCIHDAAIFKNWDKLRLSGLRLSEMREQIDLMQYEVTFHKEESQSLKEIIEDLRSMLQASDAQNIGLQVALKKCQHKLVSDTDYVYSKSLSRRSLPVEGTKLQYKPLQGEDKSVRILARELNQLRELRDKEINELISFNNQLQHDVTDLSRGICTLEDENRKLKGQLDLITKTYNSCRELFAVCVESFKEVERANSDVFTMELQSKTPSPSPVRTPSLKRKFSFSSARDRKPEIPVTVEADEHLPPEVVLIKRLEHEIEALQETSNTQLQEMARLDNDLSNCRRHLQTANFQVEALETECGRLLALEDQLVSVFNLLQKGRSQCLSRKTLGQLLLDVIDSSFGEDEQDMTADQFIRMLQQTLSECPLFLFPT